MSALGAILLCLMMAVYGAAFPVAWIISRRETDRRIREMNERHARPRDRAAEAQKDADSPKPNPLDGTRLWDNS